MRPASSSSSSTPKPGTMQIASFNPAGASSSRTSSSPPPALPFKVAHRLGDHSHSRRKLMQETNPNGVLPQMAVVLEVDEDAPVATLAQAISSSSSVRKVIKDYVVSLAQSEYRDYGCMQTTSHAEPKTLHPASGLLVTNEKRVQRWIRSQGAAADVRTAINVCNKCDCRLDSSCRNSKIPQRQQLHVLHE